MFRLTQTILALFAFAFSQQALAEGWYFDGGIGNADVEEGGFDGSDTYFRIGAGYESSDVLSYEGGFLDLGDADDGGVTASADGLFGAVKGTMPGDSVDLFGRIGIYMWDAETCIDGLGCSSDDGSDIFFGAGVGFDAGPGSLNVELHLMELDDVDVTTIGASYSVPFGR